MNTKTRIARFLTTLTCLGMASVNAYAGLGDSSCGPCYDPCCPSPNRCFFADIDYIYWTVRQDGLDAAYTGTVLFPSGDDTLSSNLCSGECHHCNFNWNSGFKIGAGLANPCCDWEIYAQYTWYRSNPKRHAEAPTNSQLINAWETPLLQGEGPSALGFRVKFPLNSASARWKFQYNNIDVLVTNEFCVNNCFTLRPSFGIKGAWFHQHYRIGYDIASLDLFSDRAYSTEIRSKVDFWGVGPKFALTAAASLFDSISIYGNVGISALWSEFHSHRIDNETDRFIGPVEEVSVFQTVCMKRPFCIVEPVIETSIGARWDTDLCCGDYGLYVKISWDNQVWFNHNHHIKIESLGAAHGNLTLQGVTASAGLSF